MFTLKPFIIKSRLVVWSFNIHNSLIKHSCASFSNGMI